MPKVTLYSRPGCHLCDDARDLLLSIRDDGPGFELDEVDIERDDELHARYLERIPVIAIEGEIVSELVPDPSALRSRLGSLRR